MDRADTLLTNTIPAQGSVLTRSRIWYTGSFLFGYGFGGGCVYAKQTAAFTAGVTPRGTLPSASATNPLLCHQIPKATRGPGQNRQLFHSRYQAALR